MALSRASVLMTSLIVLGVVVNQTGSTWVEMPSEYVTEVTQLIRQQLWSRVKQAHKVMLDKKISWEIEEQNAKRWNKTIDQLTPKVKLHLQQLEKAKEDVLAHTKHQCINILQVQKLKCLDCVASQCNEYAKTSCDLETSSESILEKMIEYLMQLFNIKTPEKLDGQKMSLSIEQGTKDLKDSTEKLLYQISQAKKALQGPALAQGSMPINLTRMQSDMEEVADSGKEHIRQIQAKIQNSEQILDNMLAKDNEIKAALEAEIAAKFDDVAKNVGKTDRSIFGQVWHETKTVFSDILCVISFGKFCSGKKSDSDNKKETNEAARVSLAKGVASLVGLTAPSCDDLQGNVSQCLHFLASCEDDCFSLDIKDICPKWYEEWEGYKKALAITTYRLQQVYDEIKEAEHEMIKAIKTHNEVVSKIITQFGWLVEYADMKLEEGEKKEPLDKVKVTSVKYDPNSFDANVVNKFHNSTVELTLSHNEKVNIDVRELVDPYDPKEFTAAAMKYIESYKRNQHLQQNDIENLVRMFA